MITVYALLEPETREIRYVGATKHVVQRLRTHWSSRLTDRSAPVVVWMKTLDRKPDHHVLQVVNEDVAHEAEEYWINLLRQVPTVSLLNKVDTWHGGPQVGYTPSAETRHKISKANAGKSRSRGHRAHDIKNRLTTEQLSEILASTETQAVIAQKYGVSHMTVSRIKRGIIKVHSAG